MDKFNAMMDYINNTPSEQARQKSSPQLKQLGLDTLAAINASNGSESQKMDAARQVSERLVQLGGVQHVGSEDLKKWFEEKKDSSGRVILREFKEENGTKNIIEKEYGLKDGKIYEMQKSESKLNDFLTTKKTHQEIFTEDQVVNNIDSFLEMENQHVVNEARYGKVDEHLERYQDAYVYLWEQVRTSSLKSDEKVINFNKLLSLKGLAQQPKPKALLANLYNRRSGKYEIEGKSYTYNASNNQFEIGTSSS